MSSYQVIPYRPELLGEIVQLWDESRGSAGLDQRRTVFRWFTEENPFLRDRAPYWCLHDGARIVGMHGHMPVIFEVDGRELPGHMAQDDLLHPACRGKGLGQVLLDGVRTAAPDFAAAMWFNDANHRSYGKCGWIDVPGFRSYVRFLEAGPLTRHLPVWLAGPAARLVGPTLLGLLALPGRLRLRRDLHLEAISSFDQRFDALWARAAPGLGIAVRRDAAYLNWRYVAMPARRYERLAAVAADGNARGAVVWRPAVVDGDAVVRVLDIVWTPADRGVVETLLLAVVAHARSVGASRVICAAAHPHLVRALRSLGFMANAREEYHMVSNWEGQFTREQVTSIHRWHLTLGDADGDIWSES